MTRLGLGLLLVGAVAILVSSGAFESINADRGVSLSVTNDSDALLNVTYPSGQPVNLEESDADNYFFGICWGDCQYDDREVFLLADNSPNDQLEVTDIGFADNSDSNLTITSGPTEDLNGPELATVTASFECEAEGGWFSRQYGGSGWIEMDVTASDGNMTIDATRRVDVECVPS